MRILSAALLFLSEAICRWNRGNVTFFFGFFQIFPLFFESFFPIIDCTAGMSHIDKLFDFQTQTEIFPLQLQRKAGKAGDTKKKGRAYNTFNTTPKTTCAAPGCV